MYLMDVAELQNDKIPIPNTIGMPNEEQELVLNQLLARALEEKIAFEPNSAIIQATAMGTIGTIANILRAFPEFPIRCEGHAKGRVADNNEAKVRLSQARAEAVRSALRQVGV